MKLLRRLESQGILYLPRKRGNTKNTYKHPVITDKTRPRAEVVGGLSDIGSIRLKVIKEKEETELFNEYISRYHYLGYKKPFGCHLRYFVESSNAVLGCLLFSGAAKALRKRDQWIGWSEQERLRNLGFIVNNARFLIFDWVKVRYLASHVLGRAARQIRDDWEQRWGYRPVLLESFVDPQYFKGTCYHASNFEYLGMTSGQGLVRKGKSYQTSPKKIFIRPLLNNFRLVLCS
jgi:hypothetical protein